MRAAVRPHEHVLMHPQLRRVCVTTTVCTVVVGGGAVVYTTVVVGGGAMYTGAGGAYALYV
jgi:hypothetical protein